jgi:nitrite reductase/ring-hydroxylating ferredoxin subunit
MPKEGPTGDACAGCEISPDRREFLRRAMAGVAAVAAALAVPGAAARALPWRLTSSTGAAGKTKSYVLPSADGAEIDGDNDVILVRWHASVYAFALSCPHQNTALRWLNEDARFQCPKHHSKYQPDGTFISGRATRSMDRFDVRLEGSTVLVDLDRLHQQDTDPAGWAAAVAHVG